MPTTILSLDYETYAEAQLVGAKSVGIWNYSRDMMTEALMVAYQLDDGPVQSVDLTQDPFPAELREALLDPHVEKWGFNSAFERLITTHVLAIPTPYEGWRCTMALANLMSFSGDLGTVGRALGVSADKVKDAEGKRLIDLFSQPQKLSRTNSLYRRDRTTNPDDWQLFLDYNVQDVVAERAIKDKLTRYEIPSEEWIAYEIDQRINDHGMPVNYRFVTNAEILADRRKHELTEMLRRLTGLRNPNSNLQILPWLRARGYPFSDLQKNTVKKVVSENRETNVLHPDAVEALRLRAHASRTSVKKYPAIKRRLAADDRLRHCFQFAGAARTGRWSGRGPQPHNLVRTPGVLETEDGSAAKLEAVTEAIEHGDYDLLTMLMAEPMTALAGCMRSSFQAEPNHELVVCDLSAIESSVIGWVTDCERLLHVFRSGLDPYKDFGTELYHKSYAEITKPERTICKPAVLGCGYQLGGGTLRDGKRTGLWGYAEAMGVDITEQEASRQVGLFREVYHEIPAMWYALERAVSQALDGKPTRLGKCGLHVKQLGKFLTIRLPSNRLLYYYDARMEDKQFEGKDKPYTRRVFSYMGMNQISRQWSRLHSSGGKIIENIVQAIARDILRVGMRRAHEAGFALIGSVHDELIAQVRRGDNRLTLELLRECMMGDIEWAKGLPLGAAGYTSTIYRKD